jgi:DNA modification methylase
MASDWITRLLSAWRLRNRRSGWKTPGISKRERARDSFHPSEASIHELLSDPKSSIGTVLEGDCVDVLELFPEKCVDLIFADPPYNLQLSHELFRPNMTRVDGVSEAWDRFRSFDDYDDFTRGWLKACRRVLKDTGTIWVIGSYHNIYRVGTIMQDLGYWFLNDIAWIKSNPMPNFRGVRFTNAHETLLWAQKKKGAKYTFNHHTMKALNDDLQMRSDWQLPVCSGKERLRIHGEKAHPTQKPEALLYRVVMASSEPGDLILDPFFGTGTTGAVAKKLGRQWIGIEREAAYVALAQERIAAVDPGLFSEGTYALPKRRNRPRVAFGSLVEAGLVQPNQVLYFGGRGGIKATVRADGALICDEILGSIHQVGRRLMNAPCNGWEHWFYEDHQGERRPINDLREKYWQLQSAS